MACAKYWATRFADALLASWYIENGEFWQREKNNICVVLVCWYVCVRERERDRERDKNKSENKTKEKKTGRLYCIGRRSRKEENEEQSK